MTMMMIMIGGNIPWIGYRFNPNELIFARVNRGTQPYRTTCKEYEYEPYMMTELFDDNNNAAIIIVYHGWDVVVI
jgi:hypothetical protein